MWVSSPWHIDPVLSSTRDTRSFAELAVTTDFAATLIVLMPIRLRNVAGNALPLERDRRKITLTALGAAPPGVNV